MEMLIDDCMNGFLFDTEGKVYIIEEKSGQYVPLRLEIDPIDPDNDNLIVMGNLLYWTVSLEGSRGKDVFALRTESLEQVAAHHIDKPENNWERYARFLFPASLDFKEKKSDYIFPVVHLTGWYAFILNAVVAIAFVVLWKPGRNRRVLPVYALDSLLNIAAENVDKTIQVEGYVTHTCKHAGKRCFIVGESQKASMRVEAKGNIGGFNRELAGSKLSIANETRHLCRRSVYRSISSLLQYLRHDATEKAYSGQLSIRQGENLHAIGLKARQETLDNYENINTRVSDETGNSYYKRVGQAKVLHQKKTAVQLSYRKDIQIKDHTPRWIIEARGDFFNPQGKYLRFLLPTWQ